LKEFLQETLPHPEEIEKEVERELEQFDENQEETKKDQSEVIKVKENKKNDETDEEISDKIDYDKLIDIVFQEITQTDKRKFLDYDEFSKVLWTTTIDKTCVLHLNMEKNYLK
jgi:hypothetical protein